MSKINEIQKELGLSQKDIAEFFGYKNRLSYANSARKDSIDKGIEAIYEATKQKYHNSEP